MNDLLGKKTKSGTIVGILDAIFYCCMLLKSGVNVNYQTWDNDYPSWREKSIIYIYFDEPQKGFTFDEWLSYHLEDPIELVRKSYDSLPLRYYLAIPIDALKKEEEDNE